MRRLSREKKREQKRWASSAAPAPVPVDVHVPVGPGAGAASIGGVPVVADEGEEIQVAVLRHLHRLAFATGHPVHATVHDERIGYVVPLRVCVDGASQYAGEPVRVGEPGGAAASIAERPAGAAVVAEQPAEVPDAAVSLGTVAPPTGEFGPAEPALTPGPVPSAALEPQPWPPIQGQGQVPAPVHGMTSQSLEAKPVSLEPRPWPPSLNQAPDAVPVLATPPAPAAALASPEESAVEPCSAPEWKVAEENPCPKPPPVREFDAVAEAVLEPEETSGGEASPFAAPTARINEAVKLGRIDEAAERAEQTVAQATEALGPRHPEVLRIRELTAYIAYLAGDAVRSFHLSLDLAALRHLLNDPRAAYGNIQSAAAAWRAVRDPLQGLHLGRDLIAVWTELAADDGPAADDLEQLEKARTRMLRLTERARALDHELDPGPRH
ncbi:tetratricopeptide repeat protein [Streptomyces sp. TG1A-60]|uniref:tetratricopeptide repeat protein n=1 Tax=Streptomyces sp. TG1A-60 TaxID=3129111 RepID=UPI0030D05456